MSLTEARRVFFSYSSKHRGAAAILCDQLLMMGLHVWFDRREIPSSNSTIDDETLRDLLRAAIQSCSVFLILVDDHSVESPWVRFELEVATQGHKISPNFQIVSIFNFGQRSSVPEALLAHPSIDFDQGYKTALSNLCVVLSPAFKTAPRLGLQAAIANGSRLYAHGIPLSDHLTDRGLSVQCKILFTLAREHFATVDSAPTVADIASLGESLYSTGLIDRLWCGSMPWARGEQGNALTAAISFFPSTPRSGGQWPTMESRIDLVLLSLWQSALTISDNNLSTLIAEFNDDGTVFLWVADNLRLHRYTLGSQSNPSVLLSEDRRMGISEQVFEMPLDNPDRNWLFTRQALANKLGIGQVQWDQIFPEPDDISAYTLWMMIEAMEQNVTGPQFMIPLRPVEKLLIQLKELGWTRPAGNQSDLFRAHLIYGGVFAYEVSPRSSISPLMSRQIKHVLASAGGNITEVEDASGTFAQVISKSAIQY